MLFVVLVFGKIAALNNQQHLVNQSYDRIKADACGAWAELGYIKVTDTKEHQPLYFMAKKLCEKLNMVMPDIWIFQGNMLHDALEHFGIDMTSNAWALSLTPSLGHICLGEDLVKYCSDSEIEAIMAHELAHVSNYHPVTRVAMAIVVFYVMRALLDYAGIDNKVIAEYCGKFIGEKTISALVSILATLSFGRYQEKEADLAAAHVIENPQSLTSALHKLIYISSQKKRTVCDFFENLQSTHPSSTERAQYLQVVAKRMD